MSKRRHNKHPIQPEPKRIKIKVEIIAALIGLAGTIIAGFLASPLSANWLENKEPHPAKVSIEEGFTPSRGINEFTDEMGVEMILVPSGKFTMGSDNQDDEKPSHTVYLEGFYIDRYEVTNSRYKDCVERGVCQLPKDIRNYSDRDYANHPVIYVDWSMAQAYCEWRSGRLPTEAEWEKAARGTDGRTYPWGEVASCDQTNYGDCVGDTTEVGSYDNASPYGIYDMGGNVWEWVADWYSRDYYRIIGDDVSNPKGPSTGEERVLRGGDWNDGSTYIRAAERGANNATFYYDVGFRCARSEVLTVSATTVPGSTPRGEIRSLPTNMIDGKGAEMVLVPAGDFTMGTDSVNAETEETPAHTVDVDTFYIDKYEVTNARYQACVDEDVCKIPKETSSYTRDSYYGNSEFDNFPVIHIDWNAAKTYCEWRGADLPTEAQWEKAARGTDGHTYPWGEKIDKTFANYGQNIGDTTAVGTYESGKSVYGTYDMTGNVWEWVTDWYSEDFYRTLSSDNPIGPQLGKFRGLRGGSWFVASTYIEAFTRGAAEPVTTSSDYGFRCARTP